MNDEPTMHPEELENARREGRPVSLSRLMRYDHVDHDLPIGSLVDVDIEIYSDRECGSFVRLRGQCRLVVIGLSRDCDGSPLYQLSDIPVEFPKNETLIVSRQWSQIKAIADYVSSGGGYGRDSLTPVGKVVKVYKTVGEYLFGD